MRERRNHPVDGHKFASHGARTPTSFWEEAEHRLVFFRTLQLTTTSWRQRCRRERKQCQEIIYLLISALPSSLLRYSLHLHRGRRGRRRESRALCLPLPRSPWSPQSPSHGRRRGRRASPLGFYHQSVLERRTFQCHLCARRSKKITRPKRRESLRWDALYSC